MHYTFLFTDDEGRMTWDIIPYINASYVDGPCKGCKYIATQSPMANTANEFWMMVWKTHATVIIALSDSDEYHDGRLPRYWPLDKETWLFGKVSVTHQPDLAREGEAYTAQVYLVKKVSVDAFAIFPDQCRQLDIF